MTEGNAESGERLELRSRDRRATRTFSGNALSSKNGEEYHNVNLILLLPMVSFSILSMESSVTFCFLRNNRTVAPYLLYDNISNILTQSHPIEINWLL